MGYVSLTDIFLFLKLNFIKAVIFVTCYVLKSERVLSVVSIGVISLRHKYTTKNCPNYSEAVFLLLHCQIVKSTNRQIDKLSNYLMLAFKYSRLRRAIFSSEIPLGHSTSQAPVLVQLPKPSCSIWFTIFSTRSVASTRP